MIEIVPAILPKSFEDLVAHLVRVRGVARLVQIDMVDGSFAPNKTWPYGEYESFETIAHEEEGMPFWEEFDFEFDVMANHPEKDIDNLVHAGAARIVIHAKSAGAEKALELLQPSRGGELGVKVGIALELTDTPAALDAFDGLYDYVQVMGIAKVGFQGQAFDERAIAVVQSLRAKHRDMLLQVDGGVRLENAAALVAAGATSLVVGSAIFATDDPKGALEALYTEVDA
jgi:ribulose-phosphate 3-epimerase